MSFMDATDAGTQPIRSRTVVALTGLSYLFVCWGFSYLDRRHGLFGFEGVLWGAWALAGFGVGMAGLRGPGARGQACWGVMGALGLVVALLPGFMMFTLLRWVCFGLLLIMGARAAVLRTRRDFYLTLTVVFAVSFMVGTHDRADWTLWVYLGPAWVLAGLALAWDHASGTALSLRVRLLMSGGFIAVAWVLSLGLFLLLPRPATLGFGFLPPGTGSPGLAGNPAERGPGGGRADAGAAGVVGTGGVSAPEPARWEAMLEAMRAAAQDGFIPQWQRQLMGAVLNAAEGVARALAPAQGRVAGATVAARAQRNIAVDVPWIRILAAVWLAYLLWQRRYRLGLGVALIAAWSLGWRYPALSMRVSARAMRWCLQSCGHPHQPGQSVREHWMSAPDIALLARKWLGDAVDTYGEARFGGGAATRQRALAMHRAVQGAAEVLRPNGSVSRRAAPAATRPESAGLRPR